MKYEIKNRWTGNVQFVAEIDCNETASIGVKIGLAVKWAIENRAVLRGAVLRDADLSRADLRGADLRGADLSRADLRGAVLSRADLSGAVLRGAVLSRAVLSRADLSRADLSGAVLRDANLRDANLSHADLRHADLSSAVLSDASVYVWVQKNTIKRRIIGERVLVLAERTKKSQHIGNTIYEPGTLYVAPFFSRCPVTECHPGLYIAGKNWDFGDHEKIMVACWMDEIHIISTNSNKARVPRFYVVRDEAHFDTLIGAELEAKGGE